MKINKIFYNLSSLTPIYTNFAVICPATFWDVGLHRADAVRLKKFMCLPCFNSCFCFAYPDCASKAKDIFRLCSNT